jgi:hypothetical protein
MNRDADICMSLVPDTFAPLLFCPPFVADRYNELVNDRYQLGRLPYPKGMKPVKIVISLVKRRSMLLTRDVRLLRQALRGCCGTIPAR